MTAQKVIAFIPEKCTACRYCEIACSYVHHGKTDFTKTNIFGVFDEETGERRKEPLFLPGQTLYGAAAFEEVDARIDELKVYGYGLTDSYRIRRQDGKRVTLIEARVASFRRPGDRFHPDRETTLEAEDWEYLELKLKHLNPQLLPEEK